MPEKDTIIHSIKIFFKPAFHSDDDEEDNETASLGFVGLYSKKNSVIFYYPECYPCLELLEKGGHSVNRDDSSICLLSSDGAPEYLENIVLPILHTISLLNPQRIEGDFKDSSQTKRSASDPILSMVYLIHDYLSHGAFKQKNIIFQNNHGKRISWNKTTKNSPFFLRDSLFFPDVVYATNEWCEPLLSKIYLACVKYSASLLGWLYGLLSDSVPGSFLKNSDKSRYIETVRRALSRTFNREWRERLSNMLAVLAGPTRERRSSTFVYGTYSYNLVFETMIDQLLSTLQSKEIDGFFPKGQWNLLCGESFETSSLRPDTISEIGNGEAIIFDAKYYRPNSLPQTESIQKQFTYAFHAIKHRAYSQVYNVFVLPGIFEDTRNPFSIFGWAEARWLASEFASTRVTPWIVGLKIDLLWLIQNYVSDGENSKKQIFDLVTSFKPLVGQTTSSD